MNARILVVDDDTALAEMIGIVLHSEGFEPSFCADGALALDAFRSVKPDLVLLDLMLPGLDGIEVCPVSYTHLRAHETDSYLVCRLLLEKKKKLPTTIITKEK